MTILDPERFAQPWRASVWCRGGGSIAVGGISAKASGNAQWEMITVEVPADKAPKDDTVAVVLTGPGEFDDLIVQEELAPSPNLVANPGFEAVDKSGYPRSWSPQKKWDWISAGYYIWTDWMHFHEENRGPVRVDPLIVHSGRQSLRFDVYPGDEKFVESDLITLNQDKPRIIEVGAYVAADRIRLFDIRCVDQDGVNLPGYYAMQTEYGTGGTATFGNGTFGWRYIRKFFALPFNEPAKGIRVRLAARGFNGNTLDDAGTRAYACQAGTTWWDDVRVVERTSDEAALRARGVQIPSAAAPGRPTWVDASVDLGERLYGDNTVSLTFTNGGPKSSYQLRLTTTQPGEKPVITESASVTAATGGRALLTAPYRITKPIGDWKQQGTFRLELLRGRTVVSDTTYAFNTWPVVIDFDIARHYTLPTENPDTTSLNLGVAQATLARVARLDIALQPIAGGALASVQTITNLNGAFAQTANDLKAGVFDKTGFNLPTPAPYADRANLLLLQLDLSKLKVWPADGPTRDTVLNVHAYDRSGKLLFADRSQGFCRMAPTPRQEPIQSVRIREDGAVLINDKPRYLFGATHQNIRIAHTPEIIAQLGLMGHRFGIDTLSKFDTVQNKMWKELGLYDLQFQPVEGDVGSAHVSLTDEQKKKIEDFVKGGGMASVISINTGGWEGHIPDTPEARAAHQQLNDWLRQVTHRPIDWSPSGAYNAWNVNSFPYYDIVQGETEMWGPMDYNVIFTPYMKRLRKDPTAWVYLPQLYDNTPYERYRFETYENIIRGSAGVSMIQGIGDPTLNRGLAGELRYLEAPLNSLEKALDVTFNPNISHKVTQYNGKTYILATNCGPIIMGDWKWNPTVKYSGLASHEGDSVNRLWRRPGGVRLHGFRGLPNPELIQAGDKIVQYVLIDPAEKPDWVAVAVRGDGRFSHVGVLGNFDFEKFREDYGNIFMYSELEHSVWHEIFYVMDPPTYQRAVRLMGKEWADRIKKGADEGRKTVDAVAYKAEHFPHLGDVPGAGKWVRIELDADKVGLTGTLVDGFAYMTKNGRALWDYSALERNGKVVRVFCEDTVGIDRKLLDNVHISVPGLKPGAKIRALFEERTLKPDAAGGFTDNFQGVDTYSDESNGVTGDMFAYVPDANRELPRMMPSGYGYSYGPTAVHIYEIEP
jgi:hypothetical protein